MGAAGASPPILLAEQQRHDAQITQRIRKGAREAAAPAAAAAAAFSGKQLSRPRQIPDAAAAKEVRAAASPFLIPCRHADACTAAGSVVLARLRPCHGQLAFSCRRKRTRREPSLLALTLDADGMIVLRTSVCFSIGISILWLLHWACR